MNPKFEQFLEAYANASETMRMLIDSEKLGEQAVTLLTLLDKDTTLRPLLIIVFSNFVLDVIDKDELEKDLIEIGLNDRELPMVISKIEHIKQNPQSIIDNIPEPEKNEAVISQKASVVNQNQVSTTQPTEQSTQLQFTPTSVEPLRTMEQDMDRIHGYGAYRKMYPDMPDTEAKQTPTQKQRPAGYQALQSQVDNTVQSLSQEDMLKRPPLADTPSYTENTPRQ